jgi:hypothetical protein
MGTIIDKDLENRALVESRATQQLRLQLDFSIIDLLSIVGALQLSLRHPAYKGPSTKLIRLFIQKVKFHLVAQPALTEVIERGFDPAFDWEPDIEE